jgi:hypothetical protein
VVDVRALRDWLNVATTNTSASDEDVSVPSVTSKLATAPDNAEPVADNVTAPSVWLVVATIATSTSVVEVTSPNVWLVDAAIRATAVALTVTAPRV